MLRETWEGETLFCCVFDVTIFLLLLHTSLGLIAPPSTPAVVAQSQVKKNLFFRTAITTAFLTVPQRKVAASACVASDGQLLLLGENTVVTLALFARHSVATRASTTLMIRPYASLTRLNCAVASGASALSGWYCKALERSAERTA